MIGGAGLGLELAEELEQLAPFGMGNPGVRLLVPSARVADVRAMGEGKHSRFSLHSGSHRAVGVAFGRSGLGVEEGDPIDAAVRLEVNRWNGSVEPRVVLRELYPVRRRAAIPGSSRPSGGAGSRPSSPRDPATMSQLSPTLEENRDIGPEGRVALQTNNSGAAMVAELASSGGGEVLAAVADTERRAPLAREGVRLVDAFSLEAEPELGARVRARRPRRPSRLRAASPTSSRSPAPAAATSTTPGARPSAGSASTVLDQHLARRAGADLGLQGAARGRRLRRRAAPRSTGRARHRGAPAGGGGALLPGPDRARAGAGTPECGRWDGRGRILR